VIGWPATSSIALLSASTSGPAPGLRDQRLGDLVGGLDHARPAAAHSDLIRTQLRAFEDLQMRPFGRPPPIIVLDHQAAHPGRQEPLVEFRAAQVEGPGYVGEMAQLDVKHDAVA